MSKDLLPEATRFSDPPFSDYLGPAAGAQVGAIKVDDLEKPGKIR